MPPDWASAPSVHDNGGLSERESLVQGARSEEPQDVEAGGM